MKQGPPLVALLAATFVAACSSSQDDDAQEPADRVVIDASAQTREEIRVASWGIRNQGKSTIVRGYDASKKRVVAFEYRATRSATRSGTTSLDATIEVGSRRAKLRIESPDRVHMKVLEDSLNGDDAAKAVLDRMAADLRFGKPRASSTGLTSQSLRPSDEGSLVSGDPTKLVGKCTQLLGPTAASAAQTTSRCGDAPSSPECQRGVQESPQAQDEASQCDTPRSCGDGVALLGGGPLALKKAPLTGPGTSSMQWHVNGTDLGIPFLLGDDSVGFLFGDTFDAPGVGGPGWRSPVLLRSSSAPAEGIVFEGSGYAPQILDSPHSGCNGEYTLIPNDGVTISGGRVIVSYMSVRNWAGLCPEQYSGQWRTAYAGLAVSEDGGGHFTRAPIRWDNDDANQDAFQMQTMQVDGEYAYVYSVRAGRQNSPMMLQRVRTASILEKGAYECWGFDGEWGWGKPCTSLFDEGAFGEPSVRKLADCTWAMSYLELGSIVTRTAPKPEGPWSPGHIQVTAAEQPCLYGGFIHPRSTAGANDLHLMVSAWGDSLDSCGRGGKYGVDHFVGTL